jgi:hypothetical protein
MRTVGKVISSVAQAGELLAQTHSKAATATAEGLAGSAQGDKRGNSGSGCMQQTPWVIRQAMRTQEQAGITMAFANKCKQPLTKDTDCRALGDLLTMLPYARMTSFRFKGTLSVAFTFW